MFVFLSKYSFMSATYVILRIEGRLELFSKARNVSNHLPVVLDARTTS